MNKNLPNQRKFFQFFLKSSSLKEIRSVFLLILLIYSGNIVGQTNISSNAVVGNWSATATWAGGVVPASGDNVTIVNGATVTIDVSPTVGTLTIGGGTSGILQYDSTARTLTTNGDVTIATGGIFRSAASGSTSTIKTHALIVGGSLVNNGTLNFSATAGSGGTLVNASGALITFTGASDATFNCSNSAAVTNLRNAGGVTLNKGTTYSTLLNFIPSTTYTSAAGATATTSSATITVGSTTNLAVGMYVSVTSGTGAFAAGTTVASITNGTQFVVSANPSTALSGGLSVVTASKFAVQSASLLTGSSSGFLSITNGTFKIGGTNVFNHPYFNASGYIVPATGGIWLNNNNAVVTGLGASPNMNGLWRMTSGTYNIGSGSGNAVSGAATTVIIVEGGTINCASRFRFTNSGASFNMSAGIINANTIGTTATTSTEIFGFTSSGTIFTMSGGTINLVQAVTGNPKTYDWRVDSSTPSITGGQVNIGTAATATGAASAFIMSGAIPTMVIDNSTNAKTVTLAGASTAYGNVTINSGSTLDLNGFTLTERGTTFTNNGTLTGTTASSRLSFASPTNAAQTFAGTGTVTSPLDALSVSTTGGLTISHTNAISTLRVNLIAGVITNSNKITLGTGAALPVSVLIGASNLTSAAGSFDVSPTFNLGTGPYSVSYLEETAARTTGFEIPTSRTITNATIANANNVTVSGGDLTISGVLTLSGGKLTTTTSNLVTVTGTTTASVVRSTYTSGTNSNSSGTTITVASTTGLSAGMLVSVVSGNGAFADNTFVTSVTNGTTFIVSATPTTAILTAQISGSGGWVNGPLAITLPASLVSGSTYVLPVGKGTYNGFSLVNPTTLGGSVTVKAETFDASSGGTAGTNMDSLYTNRYWAASITAGLANFTNTFIKLDDASVISSSGIASSATVDGAYNIVGSPLPTIVAGSSVTSTTTASTSIPGFYNIGQKSVPMEYSSSTTSQNLKGVVPNTTNNQIIGVQVVTLGNASPISVSSMTFNTTGSTSASTDITNAKVYYTGTSSTFTTTTQFGSTNAAPNGSYSITGSQALSEGTNYFWLSYDIPSNATLNNVVDAVCTSIDVNGAQIPTVTDPSGSRKIGARLNGVYSIGASQTSPNYSTLTNAITDINDLGVEGAVTFQLLNDYASNYYVSVAGATSTNTTVTVGSTVDLVPGMGVTAIAGVGAFAANTKVVSITNATTFEVSAVPTTALSGGLTVVTGSFETFPMTINSYIGSSSSNTLTIKPATGVAKNIVGAPLTGSLILLNGSDYVIIDGSNNGTTSRDLTFTNNSLTTSQSITTQSGIYIATASASDGATNNTIKNCKFDAGGYGIYSGGGITVITPTLAPNSNNSITNNEFIKMSYGINIQGYAISPYDANWVINNNVFGSTTTPANYLTIRAIRFDYGSNFSINNNLISGVNNSSTNTVYGMQFTSAYSGGNIYNNTITNLKKLTDSSSLYGISFVSSSANNNINIYNNIISDILPYGSTSTTFRGYGMYFEGASTSGYNIYHNSISLTGTHPFGATSVSPSAAIYFHSSLAISNGFNVRNNIFSNSGTSGNRFAIYSLAPNTIFSDINYNNYQSSGTNLGYIASTNRPTLANIVTGFGGNANSVNVLPSFTSASDLHLTTSGNCSLNNTGALISGITTDFDGDTRSTSTPDIGADEFSGVNVSTSSASATPSLCYNTALTNITHTTAGGATGIGSASGLPSGVTAAWATNTITISGTPSATGTFNYTIPLTVPTTGGCASVNATGSITVNALPDALVLTGSSACANTTGSISSSTSVSGENYQLYDSSNTTLGSSIAGTGSGLSWSSIAIGTSYYAKATNTTTTCISSNSNLVNVSTITDKTWNGGAGNWNTPANWSCGSVPSSSDAIIVSSGSPKLDTDFTVAGSLTLSDSGSLTINSTKTLSISDTGAVNFGNKEVIIKSDLNGTGAIGQVIGTLSNATNVTVERYIPGKRGWRALTAPVVGSTNATVFYNWQNNGTPIANTGVEIWSNISTDASVTPAGNASSLLSYTSGTTGSWNPITNTSNTPLFTPTINNPFMVFVTGPYATISTNITSGFAATTLKATGTLITGPKSYTTATNEFAFIGNPYASPLNLTTMLASNPTFGGNIWVWDANVTGTYSVGTYNLFDNGAYTNILSNPGISGAQIQSGQAFFVRSTDGASFSIQEGHKGTTFNNAVFRDAAPAELLRVGLYKQINTEWSGRDGAMTVITTDAEANQVANKMANGTENVAFTKNGLLYASEHHLPIVATDVLNVRVWNTTAGANYKLKINTEQFTATNLDATLEDLFTNSRTPLTLNGTAVEYPFSVTTEAASTGNRFRIVFENSALGINNPKATGIKILPNPITGDAFQVNLGTLSTGTYSYSICNTLGQEVEKGNINNVVQNTNYTVKLKNSTAAGMYIMKVTGTDNTVFTAKLIKK